MMTDDRPLAGDDIEFVFPSRAADFRLLGEIRTAFDYTGGDLPVHCRTLFHRLDGSCDLDDDFDPDCFNTKYFLDQLASSWNVLPVFLTIMEDAHPDRRFAISRAVERAFWNQHDGMLIHYCITSLVKHLERTGQEEVIHQAKRLIVELHRARNMEEAMEAHLTSRLHAGMQGCYDDLDEDSVAAWELLADYFLLQRACAQDVRKAARTRAPGESTAARLTRMANRLHFTSALRHVFSPYALLDRYLKLGSDPCELIDLSDYGRTRQHLKDSVLARVPGSGWYGT